MTGSNMADSKYSWLTDDVFVSLQAQRPTQGHFTHIFLDNVERAPETECLIPISGKLDEHNDALHD